MKREEKVQLTRRKIMDNALKEFSARGYRAGSVNNIYDPEQGISKGIIYHYFSSKDELFLACVEECFGQLKAYIEKQFAEGGGTMTEEEYFNRYFALRTRFFHENPWYQGIFMETVLMPPEHLKSEILRCRQPMEKMNTEILEKFLSQISLRVSLNRTELAGIILQFINFVHLQHSLEGNDGVTLEALEKKNRKILDILLNGIVERKGY